MNPIIIRAAQPFDLEILQSFEQCLINTERLFDATIKTGLISYYNLEEMMLSPDIRIVVAELNNKVIACGYAYIMHSKPHLKHEKYAYLGFMFVDPKCRGKNINSKIIEDLESWCLSRGISELRLEVYIDNQSAIKAYEKAGFTKHILEMRSDISMKHL